MNIKVCVGSSCHLKGFYDVILAMKDILKKYDVEDSELNNASYYGRIFAKSGGIAKGIADVAKEMGVEGVKPIAMNGIAECKAALTKLKFNKATENFFEGMACDGGCLNGPVCITHSPRNVVDVDKYGNEAQEKTIFNTVKLMTEF